MENVQIPLLRSIAHASFALVLAVLLSGCSTFHREWKQAAAQPTPTDDITGGWQGMWKSEATGHQGTLRCLVSKESPAKYRFLYRPTWKKILHGTYTVLQDVQREGNVFKMHGSADLGKLYGGHYEYDGQATPTHFHSTYRAQADHGTFEMNRPANDLSFLSRCTSIRPQQEPEKR